MNKPELSIVCAMDKKNLIGSNNQLPWRMPADLKFFKETTMGKPIIMGRKTWQSIGRPLPGRKNIVISRNPDFFAEGATVMQNMESAMALIDDAPEAMLIGGATLYEQTLDQVDNLFITEIDHEFDGDTWFPEISTLIWKECWRKNHSADSVNPHPYSFVKYVRVKLRIIG
ncbi:MAG: dihydrofolate reductase [Gammaproteobacteria bacterium]|jgi:dihydrofolate reductase